MLYGILVLAYTNCTEFQTLSSKPIPEKLLTTEATVSL